MKIFLSTPIAGFEDENKYIEYKEKIERFVNSLVENGYDTYAEICNIDNESNYDSPKTSLIKDFGSIDTSDVFMLHYPKKIVTSAFVELGYAIAREKRTIIITPSKKILPYLVQGIDEVYENSAMVLFEEFTEENNDEIVRNIINILN